MVLSIREPDKHGISQTSIRRHQRLWIAMSDYAVALIHTGVVVFAEHAEVPEYELKRSRISKLWIKRLADRATVFNWDRGMDVPAGDDMVAAIVDFLTAGLADLAYGH